MPTPTLPPHLHERVAPNAPPPRPNGRFVVYWVRVACRAYDNPALDVALTAARQLGVPCFVYHALSERYRYASDRLHTFILEGARDLQAQCAARGIGYAFHLQTAADRGSHLMQLARDAALVVTDAMPVQPLLKWDAEVALVAPLWRVDASCVVPMWLVDQPFERAYAFTDFMKPLWAERLARTWVDVEPSGPAFLPDLPFTPLELAREDLSALVASCDIDHSVGPVHHTPGGTAAAERRWRNFVDHRLDAYATDRNDPLRNGSSRMSAYLHFGHISPWRMAREAGAHQTAGAEKYLGELLTWRELSWNLCRFQAHVDSVDALPAWARDSLRAHERDRREFLPSWEQLARAQTGDPLWDAAQRSLLTHGELHNNVRMTWGKAVLGWARTAQEALALLVDLNHRFALDGRDPGSYGGILWCLGALDRPFTPEQPVTGLVRSRSTVEQAKRLDVAEYSRRTRLPSRGTPLIVAVVGAGVAGAAAARTLADAGHAVTVFDKGRGPGGRASTRREDGRRYDHGAQYFTVHDERFARVARAWWAERIVTEWAPRLMTFGDSPNPTEARAPENPNATKKVSPRLVATPGMGSLLQRMLYDVDVHFGVTVRSMLRRDTRWRLLADDETALGEFDAVVLAAPAPQSAALIDPASYDFASTLREAKFAPCQAVMASFAEPLGREFDAAFVGVGPLRWVARDASKPERVAGEHWVLHANAPWSEKHLEAEPAQVAAMLLDAFFATVGTRRVEPEFVKAHRWRYAFVTKPLGVPCVFDPTLRVAACGDWCLGPRIESAYLSGVAAAGRLNGLPPDAPLEEPPPPASRAAQMRLL